MTGTYGNALRSIGANIRSYADNAAKRRARRQLGQVVETYPDYLLRDMGFDPAPRPVRDLYLHSLR